MPRDSSGAYSLPSGSLVSTGDTILVSQHNPPFQDMEQAISGSLDRDGKGGMRANLAMGGNRMTGLGDGTADDDAATVGQLAAAGGLPIGAVIDYWGSAPPPGFLFAAGQAISRSTYAALFAVIGTSAGAGDGSTTFNLPDYRGRVGAGRENMATPATTRLNTLSSSTLGATGGAQTHALTTAELASHSHTVTDPGHAHNVTGGAAGTDSFGFFNRLTDGTSGEPTSTATTGITLANTGSGTGHNNVQPTIICNKIMKVE